MSLFRKHLTTFSKRPIEWTGTLQRIVRDFAEVAGPKLSEAELDNLFAIPERLVNLVLAECLQAVELRSGRDGCSISFLSDPDTFDDVDTSMLLLCDLRASLLEVSLVVTDKDLASSLGAEMITRLSSENLSISIREKGDKEEDLGLSFIDAGEGRDDEVQL